MQRKITEIAVLLAVVTTIFCIVIGKITSRSFVDDTNLDKYLLQKNPKVCYCDMGYDADTHIGFINGEEIKDIEDLMDDTIIIKAHLKNGQPRSIYYECVLSYLEVDMVYQGNVETGKTIWYFEPVDCCLSSIDCTDGYNLMQPNKEYILFLKRLKNAGYSDDKYVYAPASTTYGKYLDEDSMPRLYKESEIEEPDTSILYNEIKREEVFLDDEEMYEKYCMLKKQARRLF